MQEIIDSQLLKGIGLNYKFNKNIYFRGMRFMADHEGLFFRL